MRLLFLCFFGVSLIPAFMEMRNSAWPSLDAGTAGWWDVAPGILLSLAAISFLYLGLRSSRWPFFYLDTTPLDEIAANSELCGRAIKQKQRSLRVLVVCGMVGLVSSVFVPSLLLVTLASLQIVSALLFLREVRFLRSFGARATAGVIAHS